jgi:hypothetical protein
MNTRSLTEIPEQQVTMSRANQSDGLGTRDDRKILWFYMTLLLVLPPDLANETLAASNDPYMVGRNESV